MPEQSTFPSVEATTPTTRDLVIVARDRPDLWRYLALNFAKSARVEVVLDRRQGERREATRTYERGRQGADRRRSSSLVTDPRGQGCLIVPRRPDGR
jgi:hypothetical protein